MMMRSLVLIAIISAALPALAADQPSVHVQPPTLQGPRPLQDQTAKAVVQDYLDCWQSMSRALDQNRPDLLDRDFIGSAKDRLAATIKQQSSSGIHTAYQDKSHDVQILFYSPEGLSIQLADTVDYDVQLFDHDKSLGTQHVHTRYIVVLTPTEVRWRVRIFQAQAQ
jgi:hypothetical protein